MEKKKNNNRFIIPPSYFEKKGITPIPVKKPEPAVKQEVSSEVIEEQEVDIQQIETTEIPSKVEKASITNEESKENIIAKEHPKINLNFKKKRVSGLSIKSIEEKRKHEIRQMDVVLDEEDQPKDDFTEEALIKAWNDYIKLLEEDGKFNLASILSIDTPKVDGTTVYLEYPNATNKVEVERNQYELLGYIRKAVNNFAIALSITVNEEMEKQYAYTAQEKYEKLKEKNPNIELLKKTFGLDL